MARVSTYLNFPGTTEEAFNFYKQVFKTEFIGEISRLGDVPLQEGQSISEEDKRLVINVQLPILGGYVLMGADTVESLGMQIVQGNNVHINLEPDTKEETDALFAALSEGGSVTTPLQVMFWGDYYGALMDKYGTHWMLNCAAK